MFSTRNIGIGATVVVLLLLLVYGFWPTATPVSVDRATRDSLRVTIEEEGRTRLEEAYEVSVPSSGYLRRLPWSVGDSVTRGEVLAQLASPPSTVLDVSSYQQAQSQVAAVRAAVQRAQSEENAAQSALGYARTEYERLQRLHEQGTASQQQLDAAQTEFEQARARYESAQHAVEQARQELQAARSRLAQQVDPETLETRATIQAPVSGRIVRIARKSAGVVQAGTPLVTVGDPDSLEVLVDVLSSDAVRLGAGTPVEMTQWGGGRTLEGRVRRVQPVAQTEVSALGVEEQRTNVIVDFTGPEPHEELGAGYRVVARFVVWAGDDVLQVPQSALYRHDGGWAVFTIEGGQAQRTPVEVGHRSGLQAEVVSGLSEGDRVITHPSNDLTDGSRVEAR